MLSTDVTAGGNAQASQYNSLRDDAYGSSMLLPHQQGTPGMTVFVESGVFFIGGTKVTVAGGSTAAFTAPVSNPRIDLISVDSTGTIQVTAGTEAVSPSAPAYPPNQIVIAEVHHVVGETLIYDNDNQVAGQGYIVDVRPFLQIPSNAQGVSQSYALNTTYTNTSNRPQLHFVTLVLSSSSGSNPFVTVQNGGAVGQVYFSEGAASTTQLKAFITMFVPPNNGFYIDTGGTGTVPTIQYWYTINL